MYIYQYTQKPTYSDVTEYATLKQLSFYTILDLYTNILVCSTRWTKWGANVQDSPDASTKPDNSAP